MLELLRRLLSTPAPPAEEVCRSLAVRTAIRAGWETSPTGATIKTMQYQGSNGIGYVPISRAVATLLDAQARRAGRLYARLRRS